jgi:3-hydroxymyristoyl/3-hydroxydecanoyl-(acyl carrier protein) dehydratase
VTTAARRPFHLVSAVRREHPAAGRGEAWALAATVAIPADSRLFAGHFPGHPVLPGIAHLALVEAVLAAAPADGGAQGRRTAIVAVRNLRLRRPILPGDQLGLRIAGAERSGAVGGTRGTGGAGRRHGSGDAASGGGSGLDAQDLRFEIRRGGELASLGTVGIDLPAAAGTVGEAAGGSPPDPATDGAAGVTDGAAGATDGAAGATDGAAGASPPDAAAAAGFPEPAELLPHAPPARLLTAVLAAGPGRLAGAAAIPGDHPLVRGGEAPGFLVLEVAAQAGAALQAILGASRGGAGPRIGYLVGVRDAWLPRALPIRAPLTVSVAAAGGAAELAVYELLVEAGARAAAAAAPLAGGPGAAARPLARGTLSTFLPAAG